MSKKNTKPPPERERETGIFVFVCLGLRISKMPMFINVYACVSVCVGMTDCSYATLYSLTFEKSANPL